MTRPFAIIGAVAALAAALPRPSAAQSPLASASTRPISIGLAGGMTVPTSDTRDALSSGAHVEGFVKVRLPGGFPAFRAALNYERLDRKAVAGPAGIGSADARAAILGALGQLQLDLLQGPVRPYVVAGVGAFHLKADDGGATGSSSQLEFGVDGGAGLAVRLGPITGFAEARMRNVYTNAGWIDARTIKAVPVSFGLMF